MFYVGSDSVVTSNNILRFCIKCTVHCTVDKNTIRALKGETIFSALKFVNSTNNVIAIFDFSLLLPVKLLLLITLLHFRSPVS